MSENSGRARVAHSPKSATDASYHGGSREAGRLSSDSLPLRYEYAKAYWAGLTATEVAELPPNVKRVVSQWEPA